MARRQLDHGAVDRSARDLVLSLFQITAVHAKVRSDIDETQRLRDLLTRARSEGHDEATLVQQMRLLHENITRELESEINICTWASQVVAGLISVAEGGGHDALAASSLNLLRRSSSVINTIDPTIPLWLHGYVPRRRVVHE